MSLLKIDSDEKTEPTKLDKLFPQIPGHAEFVGCCNSLICMASRLRGWLIVLWNPALNNMSKLLPLPGLGLGDPGMVSLGFGYNEEVDDFKVVRFVTLGKEKKTVGVEVYSANSDSWTTVEQGFKFTVLRTRNAVIVNGSPYWFAMVEEKKVLVSFDVREMVFKIVPLPDYFFYKKVDHFVLVELKGNLDALVCNKKNEERVLSLDFWIFDDAGKTGWTKNHSFGTIELKVDGFLLCLKNGKILVGECLGEDVKMFLFDTETGVVKEIEIDEVQKWSFCIYGYT